MANEKLTNLEALKKLAERLKADYAPKSSLPTKVSDLANDSEFQTKTEVGTAIQTAIAETGHAKFKKVDAVPEPEAADDNVLYLVMNSKTHHYDIYAKVGEEVVLLDDTTVDLSGYLTSADMENALAGSLATDEEVAAMLNEVFGADEQVS